MTSAGRAILAVTSAKTPSGRCCQKRSPPAPASSRSVRRSLSQSTASTPTGDGAMAFAPPGNARTGFSTSARRTLLASATTSACLKNAPGWVSTPPSVALVIVTSRSFSSVSHSNVDACQRVASLTAPGSGSTLNVSSRSGGAGVGSGGCKRRNVGIAAPMTPGRGRTARLSRE